MPKGAICHIEFHTTDLQETKAFYEEIFGWTVQVFPGFETYGMFRTPDGFGGGFDAGPNADPPSDKGPIVHIEVDDVDATLKLIEERGGKTLVPKTKISDEFGYYALFLDNVGNRVALWSKT
jgi:predicted enzyme related to lactoylglutathione lyase